MARRIALTLLFVAALVGAAGGTYVATRDGTADRLLARLATASVKQQEAEPSRQQPPPSPQAVRPSMANVRGPQEAELGQSRPQPSPQTARPPMPDAPGLTILIRNAVTALYQANVTANYSVLRENAAPGFQQANNSAKLADAFADLRSRDMDLGQINVVEPHLRNDPVIDAQGLLHLLGFFAVGADQVDFELVFQMVGGRWQLFGIGVHPSAAADGATPAPKPTKPAAQTKPTVPDDAALVALIRGVVIALNQANKVDDYSVLRQMSAPGFQQANDLAKLRTSFAKLRARQLDLAPIAVIVPRLWQSPAIDQHGYLRLTGFFPSRPEQVNFDLAFKFVTGQWRLFGVGLNTSREMPAASAATAPKATEAGTAKSQAKRPPDPHLRPGQ